MCDMTNRDKLRNGDAGNPVVQGHATADILDGMVGMEKQLKAILQRLADIPTRSEVREMQREGMQIHVESCEHARRSMGAGAAEANKVKLAVGKFLGFEATGKLGMILSALFWAIVGGVTVWAIANAGELGSLWGGK